MVNKFAIFLLMLLCACSISSHQKSPIHGANIGLEPLKLTSLTHDRFSTSTCVPYYGDYYLSLDHCVDDDAFLRIDGKQAAIVRRVQAEPEPYVILEVNNFWCDEPTAIRAGPPHKVRTRRGEFLWVNYEPKHGDSGSPIFDKEGFLIGLVYGWDKFGEKCYVPLY